MAVTFPALVYKGGGPYLAPGGYYDYKQVVDQTAYDAALAAGWKASLSEVVTNPYGMLPDPTRTTPGTILSQDGVEYICDGVNWDAFSIKDYTAETLPDPASLPVGQASAVDLALAIKTPIGLSALPHITPYPRNRAGIVAAINALRAVSKSGVIRFEDEVYDISMDSSSEPIIPYRGISFIGVRPSFVFNGHVPDSNFTITGGTILDGKNSALVIDGMGFELNNSDQASGTSALVASGATLARASGQFASNGQGGALIDGICFRNVKRAFDTGAAQNIGLLYTTVQWCVCENATMDWAFKFHNFQHCEFRYLIAKTNLTEGSGFDFASNVDGSLLLPGNSTIEEIYNYGSDQRTRGVRFVALSVNNCALNQVKTGRIQSNRYGVSTTRSIAVTTTSGVSALSVSAADSAWLKVGMSLNFTGAVPSGVTANLIYFVTSVDTVANTITLASSNPFSSGAITPTASGTYTAKSGGFPSLLIAGNTSSLITACDFNGLDVECTGSTSPIVFARLRNSSAHVLEQFLGVDGFSAVVRDATLGLSYGTITTGLTIDKDSSSVIGLKQKSAGIRVLTGSVSAVNAYHDSVLANTSASEYAVTIPSGLVTGFSTKAVQQGAGKVAFVAGSGVSIANAVGLKTSGIGAEVTLVWVGKDSYVLTGSTSA